MKFTASGLIALTSVLTTPASYAAATPTCEGRYSFEALRAESRHTTPTEALETVAFWRDAGPGLWFAKDPAFDSRFRDRFLELHEKAALGMLRDWSRTPDGALGLLILLDQFPRNAFRGSPRMYATDALARRTAEAALAAGYDCLVPKELSLFMYLPFGHSEDLTDQNRSVALAQRLGQPSVAMAERHREIIRRFGRFPHRNPILGRTMRAEEQEYLDSGGYRG